MTQRPIKFRFWDGKRMYDWSWARDYQVEQVFEPDMEVWKVMQFTGLLDKNGKEIYEGDVLHFDSVNGLICGFDLNFEVYWKEELGGFDLRLFRSVVRGAHENFWCAPKGEVIGNVFESPVLLK